MPTAHEQVYQQAYVAPWLMGCIANAALLGGVFVSTARLSTEFPGDLPLRAVVWLLLVFCVIHSSFVFAITWRLLIQRIPPLDYIGQATIFVSSFPVLVVQSVFALRCWKVLKKNVFAGLFLGLAVLACFVLSAFVGISGMRWKNQTVEEITDRAEFRVGTIGLFCVTLATGIAIFVILGTHLVKSRTGFSKTDNIIEKLLRVTLETAFAMAVWVLVIVVLITVEKEHNSSFAAFWITMPLVYAHCLLYNLQCRSDLRHLLGEPGTYSSSSSRSCSVFRDRKRYDANHPVAIKLSTHVDIESSPGPSLGRADGRAFEEAAASFKSETESSSQD